MNINLASVNGAWCECLIFFIEDKLIPSYKNNMRNTFWIKIIFKTLMSVEFINKSKKIQNKKNMKNINQLKLDL